MWAIAGVALAALGGAVALIRAAAGTAAGYDAHGYGMTPRSHRRFALLSGAFVVAFAIAVRVPALPAIPLLGIYVLALVLYASSFARGFSGE